MAGLLHPKVLGTLIYSASGEGQGRQKGAKKDLVEVKTSWMLFSAPLVV